MQLNSPGATDINLLQSDGVTFRNQDFLVNAGKGFFGTAIQQAVASTYSCVQLYNPVSSGVTIMVDRIVASTLSAAQVAVRTYSTALTTKVTDVTNIRVGQSDGQGEIRRNNEGSIPGTGVLLVQLGANAPFQFELDYPFQLDEGEGILVCSHDVQITLLTAFQSREL